MNKTGGQIDKPDDDTEVYYCDDYDCEHYKRSLQLTHKDSVFIVVLRDCLLQALDEFQRQAPPGTLQQLCANLNIDAQNVIKGTLATASSS